MEEKELEKEIAEGKVEIIKKTDEPIRAPDMSQLPGPKLLDYQSTLEFARRFQQSHSTVPTHTPQSFLEQFYLYSSGGTNRLYVYINGAWLSLGTATTGFTSRIRAYLDTANQTFKNGTTGRVKLNAESYDGDGEFDSSVYTGTATATSANKLVDSGAFPNAASDYIGRSVWNTTDDTYAVVTAKDDDDTLSLSADIMANTETYELYFSRFVAGSTGYYQVNAVLQVVAAEDLRDYYAEIDVDGSDYAQGLFTASSDGTDNYTCLVSDVVYMAAGSYLYVMFHNGGVGAVDLMYRNERTFLSIHRLS